MTGSNTRFDFAGMQVQGNQAGIPELFVLVMIPLPLTPDAVGPTPLGEASPIEIHYAYMHRLIEEGKVLLIGPCMGEPAVDGQAPVPPGLGILRVNSRTEAEEIARNEPFHLMGWRHNAVLTWTPKFGSLIEVVRNVTGTDC